MSPAKKQNRSAQRREPKTSPANLPPSHKQPVFYVAAIGTAWVLVPLFWPSPLTYVTWGSVLFALATAAVAVLVGRSACTFDPVAGRGKAAKITVLLILLVVVPVLVDPRTVDKHNLPKLTIMLMGALAIGAVWVTEVAGSSPPLWRNGLHWPVLALLGWTAIATAASVSPRLSILGDQGTYDGLLATAAYSVIFFAMIQTVTMDQVKSVLGVLYFGGGGLTVLYGLIQLHDRLFAWGLADWIRRDDGSSTRTFSDGRIFSTLGNPNHLAGFLAVLVPVGLVLFLIHRSRPVRALVLAITSGALVELVQTASRGALLATLVSIGVVGLLLLPGRRRPIARLRTIGLVVVPIAVGTLAVAALPQFSSRLSSGLREGGTLTFRVNLWKAGVHMANDRPLVGHGPETFNDRYHGYKGEEMAERGPERFNGAHNFFVGQAASTGYVGLALLLSVLIVATVRSVGAWRRLRQVESTRQEAEACGARDLRLTLVGVVAGLVAYVVQASFALSQIGLGFMFWVLLALLGAISIGAGVPPGMRPRALVVPPAEPRSPQSKRDSRDKKTRRVRAGSEGITILACAGLLFAVSAGSRPLRADHNAWAAETDQARAGRASSGEAAQLRRRAQTRLINAINLNPWESSTLVTRAEAYLAGALAAPEGSPSQTAGLRLARRDYENAIELRPHSPFILERYAEILLKLHQVDPTADNARSGAIRAIRRAVAADPYSNRLRNRLQMLIAN